jgi:S1-C subfamily serine protease
MRGVNLDIFDFDFDLTWAALFLGSDQEVYGRYGGRDASSADSRLSLAGLRYAMAAALATHSQRPLRKGVGTLFAVPEAKRILTPFAADQYPAARRRPPNSCIHCHQVYDFRREALQAEGKWQRDQLWVYPVPENVGLTLDRDKGDRIRKVGEHSAAARAGLRAGDQLRTVNGVAVASEADVQYGLHRAPDAGAIHMVWLRDGATIEGRLALSPGWRRTDLSWRRSLQGVDPSPWIYGEDLTAAERRKLGLSEEQLALSVGSFLSTTARQAGIHAGDIIIGVDHQALDMTARQFQAYVRLNYKVGDRVTYNILRGGKRLDIGLILSSRPPS